MSEDYNAAQYDFANLDKLLAELDKLELTDHRYADYTPIDGVDVQQEGMRREDLMTLLRGRFSDKVEQSYSDNEKYIRREGMAITADLAAGYHRLVTGKKSSSDDIYDHLLREDRFLLSLQTVYLEIGRLTRGEKRIVASDAVAMYGLCVNGGIDDLYERYKRTVGKTEKAEEFEKDVLETKVSLAMQFLSEIHRKNKEADFIQHDPITFGMEVEFTDPIFTLLELYFMDRKAMTSAQLDMVNKLDQIPEWSKYMQEGSFTSLVLLPHIPVVAVLGEVYNHGMASHTFKKDMKSTLEVISKPAASPRTVLREILTMRKMGGLKGSWSVHETLGGVDLTPEHTEIMDITVLASAAGFLFWDEIPPNKIEGVKNGQNVIMEHYGKLGAYYDEGLYFPFHKKREGDMVENYGNGSAPAVERRSMPRFKEGSYASLVRDATFSYLAGYAIRAIQKDVDNRSEQDCLLVTAWEELQREWQHLVQGVNLRIPTNEECYIRHNMGDDFVNSSKEYKGKTYYEKFLTRVVLESQQNAQFRSEAKKIVTTYSKRVKAIIGY